MLNIKVFYNPISFRLSLKFHKIRINIKIKDLLNVYGGHFVYPILMYIIASHIKSLWGIISDRKQKTEISYTLLYDLRCGMIFSKTYS